jgi:hypothetical protein
VAVAKCHNDRTRPRWCGSGTSLGPMPAIRAAGPPCGGQSQFEWLPSYPCVVSCLVAGKRPVERIIRVIGIVAEAIKAKKIIATSRPLDCLFWSNSPALSSAAEARFSGFVLHRYFHQADRGGLRDFFLEQNSDRNMGHAITAAKAMATTRNSAFHSPGCSYRSRT